MHAFYVLALVTAVAAQEAAASAAWVVPPANLPRFAGGEAKVLTPTAAIPVETAAPAPKVGFLERIAALGPQSDIAARSKDEEDAVVEERSFTDDLAEAYGPAGAVIKRTVDRILGRSPTHINGAPHVDDPEPEAEPKAQPAADAVPGQQIEARDVVSSQNATVSNAVVGTAANNATAVEALKKTLSKSRVVNDKHRVVPINGVQEAKVNASSAPAVDAPVVAPVLSSLAPIAIPTTVSLPGAIVAPKPSSGRLGAVKIVTNPADQVNINGYSGHTPAATGSNGMPVGVVKREGKERKFLVALPTSSLSAGAIVAPSPPSAAKLGPVKIVSPGSPGFALPGAANTPNPKAGIAKRQAVGFGRPAPAQPQH